MPEQAKHRHQSESLPDFSNDKRLFCCVALQLHKAQPMQPSLILGVVKNTILNILQTTRPEADFKNSRNFIEDALLDSLDIILLVSEIESAFGVKIPGEQVIADNFSSVDAIEKLVNSLK